MANRYFKDQVKTLEGGLIRLCGHVVTSTSGTIASQTSKGFTVTKTGSETGRYTVTLADDYVALRGCNVMVVGADDTAYTSGKGLASFIRNVDVTTAKVLYVQFADAATPQADAELEDGAEFYIELLLKNTEAY